MASFSKIFEKGIASRLMTFINKNNIISTSQYGARENHSTYMAMLKLYDIVSKAVDNNEYCIGLFIDLSKAFGTLDHTILLQKLNSYGIRGIAKCE